MTGNAAKPNGGVLRPESSTDNKLPLSKRKAAQT